MRVSDAEIFGITEDSATVCFTVDEPGEVAVLVDGARAASSAGEAGPRLVRVTGLAPDTAYRLQLEPAAAADPLLWPEQVRTLPAPAGAQVASFATLNDLHFGERRFGDVRGDGGLPYWQYMNDDAIADINAAGVDFVVIKGDIADEGEQWQFEAAAAAFARIEAPHDAFLGNHDYYGPCRDGYTILGQPPAPRVLERAGWRLVLMETHEAGSHHGRFGAERQAWLADALAGGDAPALVFLHHQPVPPEHKGGYVNSIGIVPEESVKLFELIGCSPQVRAVIVGHTHRNRVRTYPQAPGVPFVEVCCTKDYPGGWGHYRLYDDGSFRQEVRRTSSARALAHAHRCGAMYDGGYRRFAIGPLDQRCYAVGSSRIGA